MFYVSNISRHSAILIHFPMVFRQAAVTIWGKMPRQNIADVNGVGVGKTQTLVGNFF